jgi:hypothetical protein
MKFENWWNQHKDSYTGSFCDKLVIKQYLQTGWEAHVADAMRPLAEEIKADAENIKQNADKLTEKINKL